MIIFLRNMKYLNYRKARLGSNSRIALLFGYLSII
jgi:hypothetical protein